MFTFNDLITEHQQRGRLYYQFLDEPSMNMGLYVLPANSTDPQSPHSEDEIYYIVQGEGILQAGDEEFPVTAGTIAYVRAEVPHKFHIEDRFTMKKDSEIE